jgi:hypothetical protein
MGGFLQPPGTSGGGGGSGALGAAITYTATGGNVNPNLVGFVAGTTGRVNITLSADAGFLSLPAGTDGQLLALPIVAGNFAFSLVALSGAATQKEILASNTFQYALNDCPLLYYDATLTQWVLIV